MTIINIDAPQLRDNGQKILAQFNREEQLRNSLAGLAADIEWHALWMAEDLRNGRDLNESFAYFNETVKKFYALLNGGKQQKKD